MPDRRTSSVTSFMSSLHFSGKVIMASVLFGFGLLLVGAILLIIATGGQKSPPLQENEDQKKQRSPMIYVGPGVMGVGAFFVIVGTVMCLFETRILRRRKNTDHESLVHSEVLPTGNTSPPTNENEENIKNKMQDAECHAESPAKSLEKAPLDISAGKEDFERQFSTSTDRAQSLTASVYVEAVSENEIDENDNEENFTSGSIQFSTPPQGEEADILNIPLGGQTTKVYDPVKMPDSPQSPHVTAEVENERPLLLQMETETRQTIPERNENLLPVSKDNEIPLPVAKDNEIPLPASKDNEIPLAVAKDNEIPLAVAKDNEIPLPVSKNNDIPLPMSSDSISMSGTTHNNMSGGDLAKTTVHPVHAPDSTEELRKSSNKVNEELESEESQVLVPTELPDTERKDLVPDSNETTATSAENTELTNT